MLPLCAATTLLSFQDITFGITPEEQLHLEPLFPELTDISIFTAVKDDAFSETQKLISASKNTLPVTPNS